MFCCSTLGVDIAYMLRLLEGYLSLGFLCLNLFTDLMLIFLLVLIVSDCCLLRVAFAELICGYYLVWVGWSGGLD